MLLKDPLHKQVVAGWLRLGRSSRASVRNFILEMTLHHCICNSNLDRQQLSVLLRINKKGGLYCDVVNMDSQMPR